MFLRAAASLIMALLAARAPVRGASLIWEQQEGHARAAVTVAAPGRAGFTRLSSSDTGLAFTNQLSELLALNNQILENGAGVAFGDVDGDGWCDVYFCGAENSNKLFRNLGNWKFEDATARAGISCEGEFSTGAAFADVDGDGDLDLLVNGLGSGTRCFLNDGDGRFRDNLAAGLNRFTAATSLALADVDGDSDLDLFVANYRVSSARGDPDAPRISASVVNGKVVVAPADRFTGFLRPNGQIEVVEKGEPDTLYLNDGKGRFSAVSWTGGAFLDAEGRPLAAAPEEWGLAVLLRDLTGDGAPDIYICNDFFRSRDEFWVNDGKGKFRAASRTGWRNMPLSSMAADAADINRDGFDDLFVVEMLSRDHRARQYQRANAPKAEQGLPVSDPLYQPEIPRNTLHLGLGGGEFAEAASLAGLAATDWSWGAVFLDVDLDGWEDALVINGNAHDVLDMDADHAAQTAPPNSPLRGLQFYPRLEQANLAFRNERNLTFRDASAEWSFDDIGISQALALADLDNDGDLDAVAGNLNQEAWLYRNDSPAPRVAVRLKGASPNTRGIGARLRVTGGPVAQTQTVICGGRYLSADDPMRVFAAGSSNAALRLEVVWPSGKQSIMEKAQAGYIYEIQESAAAASAPAPPSPAPLFEDVSSLLGHQHTDAPFDDFARQPLLPRKFSSLGPGVAWFDVNGDGREDLIIPGGTGGRAIIFQNAGAEGFKRLEAALPAAVLGRDQGAVLGWHSQPGRTNLLVSLSHYEGGGPAAPALAQLGLSSSQTNALLTGMTSAAGAMSIADVDGDGDLDVFLAGRIMPGRFPEPASSLLLINENGTLKADAARSAPFQRIGMVSGSAFADLDGNGAADLVLACDWGPVRVFVNQSGSFAEATQQLGLDRFTGLWNGVTVADFDGDGRLDIAASNWGRNTHHQGRLPWRIYYGDFSGSGGVDVLEALATEPGKWAAWRARDAVARSLPSVNEQFASYRAFGGASLEQIIGPAWARAKSVEINTLDSMVFLNRGNAFEPRPLPAEAQLAPAFGITAGDFNGDGMEDLFLAQNFFDTEVETPRYDAGRGLLLKGAGDGSFHALSHGSSGIRMHGQQRGAATADFDGDGRLDLAVGQNNGAARLFHNTLAKPGLRARLRGPAGNPQGIGAVARAISGGKPGPARVVRAGSGYASQDSPVLLMTCVGTPEAIETRWPGGQTTVHAVPPNAREITINITGETVR